METNLKFPADILQAVDFSQGNSILTLWVKPPTIEPAAGAISLAGGIPGGYCGKVLGDLTQSNLLGRAVFRVAANPTQNSARLTLDENSRVFLNDGLGTTVKPQIKGAVFDISAEKPTASPQNQWQTEIKNDVIAPETFKIEIGRDPSIFDGQYFITFSTVDKQTGLDRYEVKEGFWPWRKTASPYLLKNQRLTDIIKVKAVDKAGNERIATLGPLKKPSPYYRTILIALAILLAAISGYIIYRKFPKQSRK